MATASHSCFPTRSDEEQNGGPGSVSPWSSRETIALSDVSGDVSGAGRPCGGGGGGGGAPPTDTAISSSNIRRSRGGAVSHVDLSRGATGVIVLPDDGGSGGGGGGGAPPADTAISSSNTRRGGGGDVSHVDLSRGAAGVSVLPNDGGGGGSGGGGGGGAPPADTAISSSNTRHGVGGDVSHIDLSRGAAGVSVLPDGGDGDGDVDLSRGAAGVSVLPDDGARCGSRCVGSTLTIGSRHGSDDDDGCATCRDAGVSCGARECGSGLTTGNNIVSGDTVCGRGGGTRVKVPSCRIGGSCDT